MGCTESPPQRQQREIKNSDCSVLLYSTKNYNCIEVLSGSEVWIQMLLLLISHDGGTTTEWNNKM